MATLSPAPAVQERSRGRGLFWAGIALCLLGLGLVALQFVLGYLFVPWYSPILLTLGAILLLLSVARRRSIARLIGVVLVAVLAGFQWYFLVSFAKLPEYEGPAKVGQQVPQLRTVRADGRSFTDGDLKQGTPTVLVFFRGRW